MEDADTTFLQLHRVFFQANTIRGFRYLDDAGKILNKFAEDYEDNQVGLSGLTIKGPKAAESVIQGIRVDTGRIWFQSTKVVELAQPLLNFNSMTRDIAQVMGVTQFARLGLRAQYYMPIPLTSTLVKRFAERALGTGYGQELSQTVSGPIEFSTTLRRTKDVPGGIETLITAGTVRISRPAANDEDYEADGVLFDIDAYEQGVLLIAQLREFLRRAKSTIEERFATTGHQLFEVADERQT